MYICMYGSNFSRKLCKLTTLPKFHISSKSRLKVSMKWIATFRILIRLSKTISQPTYKLFNHCLSNQRWKST